jgi:hypothetical protein
MRPPGDSNALARVRPSSLLHRPSLLQLLLALALRAPGAASQACYSGTLTGLTNSTFDFLGSSIGYQFSAVVDGLTFGYANANTYYVNRLYKLVLNTPPSQRGGELTVTTCSRYTEAGTELVMGYSNAPDSSCASTAALIWVTANALAPGGCPDGSTFGSLTVGVGVQSTVAYVGVGAGNYGVFQLSWRYEPPPSATPTPTGTPAATPSPTRTQSGPRTASPTATPTPSHTRTPQPSPSRTPQPSATPTPAASPPSVGALGTTLASEAACAASYADGPAEALCPAVFGPGGGGGGGGSALQACAAAGYRVVSATDVPTGRRYLLFLPRGDAACPSGYGVRRGDGSGRYDVVGLWPGAAGAVTVAPYNGSAFAVTAAAAADGGGLSSCSWAYTVTAGACLGASPAGAGGGWVTCSLAPPRPGACAAQLGPSLSACADGGYDVTLADTGGVVLLPRLATCAAGSGLLAGPSAAAFFVLGGSTPVSAVAAAGGAGATSSELAVTVTRPGLGACTYAYAVTAGACLGAAAPPPSATAAPTPSQQPLGPPPPGWPALGDGVGVGVAVGLVLAAAAGAVAGALVLRHRQQRRRQDTLRRAADAARPKEDADAASASVARVSMLRIAAGESDGTHGGGVVGGAVGGAPHAHVNPLQQLQQLQAQLQLQLHQLQQLPPPPQQPPPQQQQ